MSMLDADQCPKCKTRTSLRHCKRGCDWFVCTSCNPTQSSTTVVFTSGKYFVNRRL